MEFSHISGEVMFLLGSKETLTFSRMPYKDSSKPTPEQLREDIIGVQLSYAFCGEQDFGIEPLAKDFGAFPSGFITKIPQDFYVHSDGDIVVLKHGRLSIDPYMYDIARETGVAGYWDDENLVLCASKEYDSIIASTRNLITSRKAKFAFRTVGFGRNLLILSAN